MTVLQLEDWASKCSRRLLTFAGSISLDFEFTVTFLVASTGGVWERGEYLVFGSIVGYDYYGPPT